MDRPRVAIVIPALNESKTIAGVVAASLQYGTSIVVDDGSSDSTADLARQSGAVVVSHDVNRGYDAALDSGFKKAVELRCDVILTLDADGQHDPSLIQKFIDQLNAGADVVVGVRSERQRFAEHVFAWYTKVRYRIHDPLCGMKAYKANVYYDLGHFDSYGSIGTELVMFAAKNGFSLAEVAFVVRPRIGNSRFGQVLSGNLKIFRALVFSFLKIK